jgi:Fe2+ or Zn2+ uptake regulation protein
MARTLASSSAAKVAELEPEWRERTEAWARQRLSVIWLVAQHELSAERIAAAAGVNRSTVFRYLDNFQAGGVAQVLRRGSTGGKEPTLAVTDHTAFFEQLRAGKFRRAKQAQA